MDQKSLRILLVEDDRIDQLAFKKMVEQLKLNYTYDVVSSASEARQKLNNGQYDAVITDYMLGDGTAFDILEVLEDTPIIITTGAGNEQIAVNVMKKGAYDYLIKDAEGSYLRVLPITIENAVMRMKYQKQLRMLSHAIMSIVDSVYVTDMEDHIIFVNQAFEQTYGFSKEEVLGVNSCILSSSKDCGTGNSLFEIEETYNNESLHVRKDGSSFPVLVSRSHVKDESGKKVAVVGVVRDISEIREAQKKLNIYATTDILTGVLNRRAGLLILEKELQLTRRNGGNLTIGYIDLDGLKAVNDKYGHQTGDELIVLATNVLNEALRESDTICRMGGDEFLIILPQCELEQAEQVWSRVDSRIKEVNLSKDRLSSISLSHGFVQYDPDSFGSADELIAVADMEMYKDKKSRKTT